jgi:hypothetical protein
MFDGFRQLQIQTSDPEVKINLRVIRATRKNSSIPVALGRSTARTSCASVPYRAVTIRRNRFRTKSTTSSPGFSDPELLGKRFMNPMDFQRES